MFTLPSTFSETYYVDSDGNIHEQQEYNTPVSTTDVQGNLIVIGTQIATGSYVGTGTYGQNNPNSLTLNFKAKIMIVARHGNDMGDQFNEMLIMSYAALAGIGIIESHQGIQNGYVLSLSGNTHNWYAQNAGIQMNLSGVVYDYITIG